MFEMQKCRLLYELTLALRLFKTICRISDLSGKDTLYWTDMGSNKISRSSRDQTCREDIVSSGLGRVEGLAVDWVAGANVSIFLLF